MTAVILNRVDKKEASRKYLEKILNIPEGNQKNVDYAKEKGTNGKSRNIKPQKVRAYNVQKH